MTKSNARLGLLIGSLVIQVPAWIYLFLTNWKLGLAIFLLFWAQNLDRKSEKYE